jgi:type IV secretory pathway protease TraF
MRQVTLVLDGPSASVNKCLLPDERSVLTVRMHPAALAGPFILACGGLVAARKLTSRSARPDIIWGTYLFPPLYFLHRLAAWPVTYVAVTDKRILVIGGLASRTAAAMSLDKATGLTLQRTALGRLLGYGTLIVASPSRRQAVVKVRYLPYPEQLYLEIAAKLWPEEPGEAVSSEGGGEGMTSYDSAERFQQE